MGTLHGTFLALHTVIESVLKALSRPQQLITQINAARRDAERNRNSLGRSNRWPLGLLDDARQRLNDERGEKAHRSEVEAERLGKELKYTQQTVAQELAGWRDVHEKVGRRAIRELARGMVIAEKMRLDGMLRALRRVQNVGTDSPAREGHAGGDEAAASNLNSNGVTPGLSERRGASLLGQLVASDREVSIGESATGTELPGASSTEGVT
jgi:hypothetical protein